MTRVFGMTVHYIEASECYTAPNRNFVRSGAAASETADVARRIVDLLADRQAEEILLLDIRRVASFADYFVIGTAANPRQMSALVDILSKEVPKDEARLLHKEGDAESGWVLIDYGAVIVHLFSPEARSYYALEELWQAGTPVVRIQ